MRCCDTDDLHMALEKSFICSANLESNNKKSKCTVNPIATFDRTVEMSFEEGLFFFFFAGGFFLWLLYYFLLESTSKAVYLVNVFVDSEPVIWVLSQFKCQGGETEIEALHLYCIHFYFESNGRSGELIACFYFSLRGGCTATGEATILIGSWRKTDRYKALKKAAEQSCPYYK